MSGLSHPGCCDVIHGIFKSTIASIGVVVEIKLQEGIQDRVAAIINNILHSIQDSVKESMHED